MSAPEPEILDLAYLRRQSAGDIALERELLRLLLGQCSALLPLLTSWDDPDARRDAAHSLRGAAAGLGATRLAAAATAIDQGREPPLPIERAVGEVRAVVERLLATEEYGRSAA